MTLHSRPFSFLATTTLLLGLALSSSSLAESAAGTVKYAGEEFRNRAIRMGADPKCEAMYDGQRVLAQDRLVDDAGGVANVFVYVKNPPAGSRGAAPPESVKLTQKGCLYGPRTLGIRVEQDLEIVNEDPLLHNVRALARSNRPFNLGQPSEGTRTKTFQAPENAIKVKCDVHPWMSAHIFVMDHPFYAVTDETGSFQIEDLPKGSYTLVAWHETFGEIETDVEVSGNKTGITLTFE